MKIKGRWGNWSIIDSLTLRDKQFFIMINNAVGARFKFSVCTYDKNIYAPLIEIGRTDCSTFRELEME